MGARQDNKEELTDMNQIDLSGRTAVVTGGAQGIGLSIITRFLASGAKVSLWDQDAALLQETCAQLESQGSVHSVAVELTDAKAVAQATSETASALSVESTFLLITPGLPAPPGLPGNIH